MPVCYKCQMTGTENKCNISTDQVKSIKDRMVRRGLPEKKNKGGP